MTKEIIDRKTRIVFVGTRTWELTSIHLKYFVENKANIVAFVESPTENLVTTTSGGSSNKNIAEVAEEMGIPIVCPATPKDPEFLEQLRAFKPDIVIVCGYQFFLPNAFLDIPPMGVVNFHTSLLPRHCGRHPGFLTIWYGDKESGMTLHYMDSGLDTGDIVYMNKVPVMPGDTVDKLYERIWKADESMVVQLLDDLDNDSLPRIPQDPNEYWYNYELDERDFELDFRLPAQLLYNRVHIKKGAFYFVYKDTKYFVTECSLLKEPTRSRRYDIRRPYVYQGELLFTTPNHYLQIDKIMQGDKEVHPLEVIDKAELKEMGVKKNPQAAPAA